MAPLMAKREREERRLAELEEKLNQASFEVLRLRHYLQRAEEENRRLAQEVRAALLGRAWDPERLSELRQVLEEAWLELVLHASPQASKLEALIQGLERLLAGTPRRSEREPPPPAP
ncbi:MAG: hypothetical protein ACP5JV_08115 [Thermus sp.]|uniref:hypothetical protein n=1 Tax=Thermus sp. TaxID=275 RepID=UPI003D0979E1